MRKTVSGIDLTLNPDGSAWMYRNTINKATFRVTGDGDIFYDDPFGNYMTSSPRQIRINFEHFVLRNYGDEIRRSDGVRMIMLPKKEIQEIANKTFYADDQFHAIDFVTFIITEEK
ncbi:hypothetical protein IRZ71_17695 [Flavobacterium sp. ANB]|uniref:hypothetical protein n=1 Tax=unclassified Flavobacterium TaxID=196869 RepID=UPI0012B70008|nr:MULTISPECIES: hypothetical protein [unclassified Flavobacterium]MBF4518201.1 hypothetical protein [Flavobacterium sp. ANB]MTD72336.1 hypothetical protein [Flavobacterium sp. LC2016-13]